MKYLYFLGTFITGVLILIVFFQNIFTPITKVRFLIFFIDFGYYNFLIVVVSILFGIFITLFIKSVVLGDKDFDDEFSL